MRMKTTTSCHRAVRAALLAVLLCLGLVCEPSLARADEPATTENPEYTAALERLNSISAEYDVLSMQQDETYTRLEQINAEIDANKSKAAGVQQDIEASQAKLAEQQKMLSGQIVSEYKTGGVSLLSILLTSASFEDAVSRMYYHNAVCQHEAEYISSINATKSELQDQKSKLNSINEELQSEKADVEELYSQQQAQADMMYQQQLEASALVQSLPREIQVTLDEDVESLIGESQAVLNNEEENQEASTGETADESQGDANSSQTTESNESASEGTKPTNTSETQKPTSTSANTNSNTSTNTSTTQKKEEQPKQESTQTPTTTQTQTQTPAPTVTSGGSLQTLIDTAYATGPTRKDWGCSGWVYIVFKTAGISKFSGSASQFYSKWCYSSDRSQLKPGMIIAVNNTGGSAAGRMYGHIGIYLGNNTVRHFTRGAVSDMSVDSWIRNYGRVCTPRWGWNGGVALS